MSSQRALATKPTSRDRRAVAELGDALYRCEPGVSARELMAGPVTALLRATRGGSYSLATGDEGLRVSLTGRQAEVVALVARGLANKTIAAHLRCAESTVEMHLTAVFARTQAESRAELVARFWKGTKRWT